MEEECLVRSAAARVLKTFAADAVVAGFEETGVGLIIAVDRTIHGHERV
jgi:hypothetical protein